MTDKKISRRSFLRVVGGASLVFPNLITSKALGADDRSPANDRIVMAAIGIGNRGIGDLGQFLNDPRIQVVAVCDVKKEHRDRAKAAVDKIYSNQDCQTYVDYREVLARGDIDMIMCANA